MFDGICLSIHLVLHFCLTEDNFNFSTCDLPVGIFYLFVSVLEGCIFIRVDFFMVVKIIVTSLLTVIFLRSFVVL